jgi:hypothetical protein
MILSVHPAALNSGITIARSLMVNWRREWIRRGLRWHSRALPQPPNWNPYLQMFSADLGIILSGPTMGQTEVRVPIGERPLITFTLGAPVG